VATTLKGERLLSKVPFGHWKTQTFIAGLRWGALTAPFVIDAPMNRRLEPHRLVFLDETGTTTKMTRLRGRCRIFETYVETQLAPTLKPGDIVILDNLPAHKSAAAEATIRARGAWLLFLPPYSPDLNPIEMGFAKLKALLRARAIGPLTPSGAPSAKSAISSVPKNARTSSPPQVTDSYESPML